MSCPLVYLSVMSRCVICWSLVMKLAPTIESLMVTSWLPYWLVIKLSRMRLCCCILPRGSLSPSKEMRLWRPIYIFLRSKAFIVRFVGESQVISPCDKPSEMMECTWSMFSMLSGWRFIAAVKSGEFLSLSLGDFGVF